jgi:hypothetical protein
MKYGSFALLLFAGLLLPSGLMAATERKCDINKGPCSITYSRRTIMLNVEPKPVRAMQELSFSVTISPSDSLPDKLLLDLSMPGMQMGNNQVALLKKSGGTWQGKGVIVRCMSGRTLWRAQLLSVELDNPAFLFNVSK